MPPEAAETREWLRKADDDRRLAEAGLSLRPPITDGAAFHCQQAVEKLLKGYLVAHGVEFEKVRDLEALVSQAEGIDASFAVWRVRLAPLTAYAVRFRYPGPQDPTVAAVEAAIAVVRELREFVESRLT